MLQYSAAPLPSEACHFLTPELALASILPSQERFRGIDR